MIKVDLDELIEEIRSKIHIMEFGKEYAKCVECAEKDIFQYMQILICLKAYRAHIEKPQEHEWKPNKYYVIGHIPFEFRQYKKD